MFGRIFGFVYGVICYAIAMATFVYAAGFLVNVGVPKSLDGVADLSFASALAIDVGLLLLFAVQHSVMARQGFKRVWARIVPPAMERSTYLLFSSAALFVLFWKWEPIGGVLWNLESPAGKYLMYGLYALGWLIVLAATFLINHLDLFGLRQVWLNLRRKKYTGLVFRTPGFYRIVRHPLYVGWLLVFWSAPRMTAAHLVFAMVTTLYILVAIQFEERDLMRIHPEYAAYRNRVPMLIPVRSAVSTSDSQLGRQQEMEG
ncbi:MAG TPA: isoprenylcysteine carboxylmethyltransferase family protein [Terriglobales bacterium]|nr:isoprenylcysteine carboxylmethyltransferase family protein [Terriglobales bacterium]